MSWERQAITVTYAGTSSLAEPLGTNIGDA